MTPILTVLGALGVLRHCRKRHATFRWVRCPLQYQHSGRCEFGWIDVGGLACNLDAPPPGQPAALIGGYTVTIAAPVGQTLSLGPSEGVLRYNEYLLPRRRRWWRR